MLTSLLYHAFGVPTGYEYQRSYFKEGCVRFVIKEKPKTLHCSHCHSRDVSPRGSHTRHFKTLAIGDRPCFIELAIPRVECMKCKLVRQVKVRFSDGSSRHTKCFKQRVITLLQTHDIKAVANYLKMSWDFVKDIQKDYLKRRYDRPNIRKLKRIAIDEIYMGKKAGFLTIVLDLQRGVVVFVGDGKSGEALAPFWKRLKRAKVKLEAVATDMESPFIKSARDNQPDAVNVADHFHVVKLYNEKLTNLRRDLQRDAENDEQKTIFKGTRWLLMMTHEKI